MSPVSFLIEQRTTGGPGSSAHPNVRGGSVHFFVRSTCANRTKEHTVEQVSASLGHTGPLLHESAMSGTTRASRNRSFIRT